MRSILTFSLGAATLGALVTTVSDAQERPATGFTIAIHATGAALSNLAASAGGVPQFSIGIRGERYGLGVGVGIAGVKSTDETVIPGFGVSTDRTTLSALQIGPSGWIGLWRSPDARTSAHVVAGVSIGRAATSESSEFVPEVGPPTITETTASGTLFGLRVGLGADYFAHRHFALGLEAGLQGVFASGIGEEDGQENLGLSAKGTYTALRLLVVF